MGELRNSSVSGRLPLLVLGLVTLLIYLPLRQHGWITYDDAEYITENRIVQAGLTWPGITWAFTTFHASLWIPVTWLSHMLDCTLFGLDPGAHHVVNMLLHAANGMLFFWVFWRMTGAFWPMAFAAAFFAWHPLRVESVAWAAERKDLLAAFFGLLSVWAYFRYTQEARASVPTSPPRSRTARGKNQARWYAFALLFFALGLMSKPMLVTLPFVLLLLDVWPLRRQSLANKPPFSAFWHLMLEKWPFFIMTTAISIVTSIAARSEAISASDYGLGMRLGNAVLSYGRYLFKALFPAELAVIYPLPAQIAWGKTLVSAVVLALISWGAVKVRRERPWCLVGWLWFLGMLVPVIGLVQVGTQAMADRFTYLPFMGLALAVAFEGCYWSERIQIPSRFVAIVSAIVLAACLFSTARQVAFWRDSVTLFEHTLAVTGPNAAAHASLGVALEQNGRTTEAMRQYEAALRLMPNLAQAHNNLANLLDIAGRKQAALHHYREAVRLKPKAVPARLNLGSALVDRGDYEEGLRQYAEAARLQPSDPRPFYLSAKARLREGRTREAISELGEALQRDPADLPSLLLLARILATNPDAALRNGTQAVMLAERANDLTGGEDPAVLDTLAMGLAEAGRFADARQVAGEAIRQLQAVGATNALAAARARLQLYSSNQPFRENVAVPAP